MATILYFAALRDAIGMGEEQIDLPDEARTVADLVDHLALRSDAHARGFADRHRLRVALDLELVAFDTPVGSAREIAFFPPVTGG